MSRFLFSLALLSFACLGFGTAVAADEFIPRRQSQPPGPPLSPQQALAKMTVHDGFHVELVAAEPDLQNPVAMAFDDRGRIFVTESFEYPRHEPGPGRDRIKILEDTNNDGQVDSVKIFAEGLNIPSGIAVGYGGVWVANAPDILFLEDTDGDDRADRRTVVATGFGRDDTHELPNALTWGPDGFLYGLNGVFNRSVVQQGEREYDFTCAMFRIDPITHRFDLFCEGTSNPWGIAFDDQGSAFISACVIDHLWHLTETGYYHRQGGPYPPHTWKIESIVDYKHQMAAYCGLAYFDSPAYPPQYRNKLYMGNIHGGCINVDSVHRAGSTYRGKPHPDFLTANDVWFMPVAQKVGPDGCLYVLDWYDRYHCYQDASADPEGVDRGHGRLYRVVFDQRPPVRYPNLTELDSAALIELLDDENIFYRQRAAVILGWRLRSGDDSEQNQKLVRQLFERVQSTGSSQVSAAQTGGDAADADADFHSRTPRLRLLTTLLYAPQTTVDEIAALLNHPSPLVVAWTVRAAATRGITQPAVVEATKRLTADPDPRVRLQVAIAANKIAGGDATRWLLEVLANSQDDGLLPRIVWENLEPHVESDQAMIRSALAQVDADGESLLVEMTPRICSRLLADLAPDLSITGDKAALRTVFQMAANLQSISPDQSQRAIESVLAKLRTGEIRLAAARPQLALLTALDLGGNPAAMQIRAYAGNEEATRELTEQVLAREQPVAQRRDLLNTLAQLSSGSLSAAVDQWIGDVAAGRSVEQEWRDALIDVVIGHGQDETIRRLLTELAGLPVGVQATVAERLSQRESTARMLLEEIASGRIRKEVVSPNQVRLLAASDSEAIVEATKEIWGTVRATDSAERQRVVRDMTQFLLEEAHGDARRGLAVYDRICGQCHLMNGRGNDVGPDITRNGRGHFEQLVVSVFDPSLVIGEAYQSVTVLTVDGRIINGLVTEQSDQRLVLKIQGGKTQVIPQADIEAVQKSPQSLMPEGVEGQMTPQEVADLFALLSLQQLPGAQENEVIAGTPAGLHQQSSH